MSGRTLGPALVHPGALPEATPGRSAAETAMLALRWLAGQGRVLLRQSHALLSQTNGRRLRVAETVSLGEKRFVSLLEVDGERLLVGGGTGGVVLLTRLRGASASNDAAPKQETDLSFRERLGALAEPAAMQPVRAGFAPRARTLRRRGGR